MWKWRSYHRCLSIRARESLLGVVVAVITLLSITHLLGQLNDYQKLQQTQVHVNNALDMLQSEVSFRRRAENIAKRNLSERTGHKVKKDYVQHISANNNHDFKPLEKVSDIQNDFEERVDKYTNLNIERGDMSIKYSHRDTNNKIVHSIPRYSNAKKRIYKSDININNVKQTAPKPLQLSDIKEHNNGLIPPGVLLKTHTNNGIPGVEAEKTILVRGNSSHNNSNVAIKHLTTHMIGHNHSSHVMFKHNTSNTLHEGLLSQDSSYVHNISELLPHMPSSKKLGGGAATMVNQEGLVVVQGQVYWGEDIVQRLPQGLTDSDISQFLSLVSREPVVTLSAPTWRMCGRAKNQYGQLRSGGHVCVRYREGHPRMIQGELLSFTLSRLLGLHNVPPSVLSIVDTQSRQWAPVAGEFTRAGWASGVPVAIIMWIDELDANRHGNTKLPPILLDTYLKNSTLTGNHPNLKKLSSQELWEIVQWTDLIVFDYITCHYDRIAALQDAVAKNETDMTESVRNVQRHTGNGGLWFIDNEAGLLDGYELVYGYYYKPSRFYLFHSRMLQTVCIFSPITISHVTWLASLPEPHSMILQLTEKLNPGLLALDTEGRGWKYLRQCLKTRLNEILEWVKQCKKMM